MLRSVVIGKFEPVDDSGLRYVSRVEIELDGPAVTVAVAHAIVQQIVDAAERKASETRDGAKS
jgi:hypothetical protein